MKKNIFLIIVILLLTGCYNYKELNKIGIVSSISIDKKNDNYIVGSQVMNIKSDENIDSPSVIVYEEEGKSIEEALRKTTKKYDKKLFGGHLSKLVISEEVAKDSIVDVIDLFQRLPEIKTEFTITIAKNTKALDVIKIMTPEGSIPADFVKNEIDSAFVDSALTYSSKLDEFVSYYLKKYIDPVVSVIEVENLTDKSSSLDNKEETNPKTKIVLNNIAFTKNGKLIDYLDENETIGYNLIRDNVSEMIIPIKCDEKNYASISIINNKTEKKIIKNNNNYKINFNIRSNGYLNEYNCNKNLKNEKNIDELEKQSEKKIKEYIDKVLLIQNNTNSEFLGLKRMIYLDYPNYNNEDFKVNLDIEVNISRKGEINNGIKGEKYENK